MGFRDRFFTPRTAKAIMSWRILVGLGVGAALAVAGLPIAVAIAGGVAVYAATVVAAMPKATVVTSIDPFTVGEPWRQFVQSAQRSRRRLLETISTVAPGPLRDRLQGIAEKLDQGIRESWEIARRGHEIDGTIRHLDPTRLRSNLETLRQRAADSPTENLTGAIASVESQLASADRLRALSDTTADRLRLTQARFDELVSRAAEVKVGQQDDARYASDVDDLVLELEAMHQAVRELPG